MDHQIPLIELAEIDLSAVTLGVIEPSAGVWGKTTKQFRGRQNDDVCGRKTKTARERAKHEIDIFERVSADQLSEPFGFAFGLKINDNPRVTLAPLIE